jgi:hypothetical protein
MSSFNVLKLDVLLHSRILRELPCCLREILDLNDALKDRYVGLAHLVGSQRATQEVFEDRSCFLSLLIIRTILW